MIEVAILGLLAEHDLHGYELRKRLNELVGMRLAVSFGSLYPALSRLERAGHVKAVSSLPRSLPPSSPMSGALDGELAAFRARRRATGARRDVRGTGRGKKVYGLTDAGRERLHELLTEADTSDDRTFAARVAFCHHLSPRERIDLFQRRRAELIGRRDRRRATGRTSGRINRYRRSLLDRDAEALAADVAWLDRLIEAERGTTDRQERQDR